MVTGERRDHPEPGYSFTLKLDSNGNTVWLRYYEQAARSYEIINATDGGYVIGGRAPGIPYNFFILKTDSLGHMEWQKKYFKNFSSYFNSITRGHDGGYLVTGFTEDCPQCPGYSFVLRLNDSGDSLNLFTYSYSDYTKIRKIEDGYLIGASYFDTTVNYAQTLLFKINKSFELYFQKKINSDGREILKDVRVINDNKFVIAADYDTLGKRIGKIYIVDSLGNIIHRNLFDYSNWDFCLLSGVMPFDNGDIAFVGIARLLFSQNWQDIFVARTDSTLFSKPIGIKNINNFVFQDYKLYQNYPNPFNPSTKITFNIPMNAKVTLRIYDMLGKEVTRLIDQNLTVGNYSIQFDGSLFSSGVYFYSLNAEGSNGNVFSATKRMVLLK